MLKKDNRNDKTVGRDGSQIRLYGHMYRFISGHGINIGMFGFFSWSLFFTPAKGSNPLDYFYNSKIAGLLMLLAWTAQLAGAYLKRYPFQNRLGAPPEPNPKEQNDTDEEKSSLHPVYSKQESKIFFFMMMHPIISGMLFGMGCSNIFPELQTATAAFRWWSIPWFMLLIGASILPTVFTAMAMFPVRQSMPRYAWMNEPWVEYVADQLIIFSFIILFSSIFGMPAMMQGIKPVNPTDVLDWIYIIIVLTPLLWLGIMFFFIPFRILLMLEDFGTWRSRASSLFAISPIIWRYIFG